MICRPGARTTRWGVAAATVYLTMALLTSPGGRSALLFDGLGPPPRYNWVRPPEPLARGNVQPASGSGTPSIIPPVDRPGVSLTTPGSQSGSLSTPDGQASVLFVQGAFSSRAGESAVRVTLTPLHAERLRLPPSALRFDGNAYRIEASYPVSQSAAMLQKRGDGVSEVRVRRNHTPAARGR